MTILSEKLQRKPDKMSFGDISKGSWAPTPPSSRPASDGDEISRLSTSLQNLQRDCHTTKEMITSMRRRKIGPSEKNELVMKIKEIRETESKIKLKLDSEYSKLDALPRPEAAPKRTTLGKLMKDFEKIKVNIQAILNESTLVKVVNERGEIESFSRVGAAAGIGIAAAGTTTSTGQGSTSGGGGVTGGSAGSYVDPNYPPKPPLSKKEQAQQQQQMKLQPLMSGQVVDAAILEERERDIKKMNRDLVLVNEMFKDMAVIVDKQGAHVSNIHTAAENSQQRAKAGLDEVNKAAEYQPGCVVC